jgi:hypothetical protein
MTPAQTRHVMAHVAMPLHTRAVAGVGLGGILMPWIGHRRAAGRPELRS